MPTKNQTERKLLSSLFNALGNPTRLKILSIIGETKRPLHIKAIAEALEMDYGAVYRHIEILRNVGVIQIFEVGRSRVLAPLHAEILSQIFVLAMQVKPE